MMQDILMDDEAERIIRELYERGYALADYAVKSVLGGQIDRQEREDVIQEGFLRLILHVETLRPRDFNARLGYLYSTMRNAAIDEGRRRSKKWMLESLEGRESEDVPSGLPTPEEICVMEAEANENRRRLYQVLERLKSRERALLIEKYKNGLSDEEIGRRLGIRKNNVRVYIARAREKAFRIYGEMTDGEQKQQKRKKQQERKEKQDRPDDEDKNKDPEGK